MNSTIEALLIYNAPDIVEKKDWGFYLGYFKRGTDETGTRNCMIIEMRTSGEVTTRKFAEGVNFDTIHTWAERENYTYKYGLRNI